MYCSAISSARSVEAKKSSRRGRADPERPAHAAGKVQKLGMPLVEPRGGHRSAEIFEVARAAAGRLGDREDHLGVDGHVALGPLEAVAGHQLVVVEDRAVMDSDDRAVAHGVVVRGDPRVALRVVADVEQNLSRVGGYRDPVEHPARAGALLVEGHRTSRRAVRVPNGVGAPLGDPGQECLGGPRPVDSARPTEAVSRNTAHTNDRSPRPGRPR